MAGAASSQRTAAVPAMAPGAARLNPKPQTLGRGDAAAAAAGGDAAPFTLTSESAFAEKWP